MAAMVTLENVIETVCLFQDDLIQQKYKRYESVAPDVYNDLNFSTLKIATRQVFDVNKRTNSIILPCDVTQVSSVSLLDCYGVAHPCFINPSINENIVDLSVGKNCTCGCKKDLCNLIKGYETVKEIINAEMPDGSFKDFVCFNRKHVDSNGFYYEQKQYPQREYTNGIWTDTVLHTEDIELCKLQVDEKGCVDDCEENYEKVIGCGCYNTLYSNSKDLICKVPEVGDTWIAYCGSRADIYMVESGCFGSYYRNRFRNIYNISGDGRRLIFPPDFGYAKVEVRLYENISIEEMMIPLTAKACFGIGLKVWESMFDDKLRNLHHDYARQYALMKGGLLAELNKMTIAEIGQMLAPKKYIPSFIPDGNSWGNYYN